MRAVERIAGFDYLMPPIIPALALLKRHGPAPGLALVVPQYGAGLVNYAIPRRPDTQTKIGVIVVDWELVGETDQVTKERRSNGQTRSGNGCYVARQCQPRPRRSGSDSAADVSASIADPNGDTSVLHDAGWVHQAGAHDAHVRTRQLAQQT